MTKQNAPPTNTHTLIQFYQSLLKGNTDCVINLMSTSTSTVTYENVKASPPITFDVFVVVKNASDPTTPIESLFLKPVSSFEHGVGFSLSSDAAVSRIEATKVPLIVDTKISRCGRRTCNNCHLGSYMTKPVTPDYEVFKTAVSRQIDGTTNGIIILKESTVSASTTADDVARSIAAAEVASGGRLDAFYAAKWLDRPDQFDTLSLMPGGGRVVRTWNANGIQALAFTSRGVQKILAGYNPDTNPVVCRPFSSVLNAMTQQGSLFSATTTPSLLQYDSTRVSIRSRPEDLKSAPFSYLKCSEVRGDTQPERLFTRRISADLSLFWVVIIIIVVSVSTWFILKFAVDVTNKM